MNNNTREYLNRTIENCPSCMGTGIILSTASRSFIEKDYYGEEEFIMDSKQCNGWCVVAREVLALEDLQ